MTYSHPSDLSKPLISSNHTWKPIFLLEVLLTHTVPLPPSNHPRLRFRLMCSIVYCMVINASMVRMASIALVLFKHLKPTVCWRHHWQTVDIRRLPTGDMYAVKRRSHRMKDCGTPQPHWVTVDEWLPSHTNCCSLESTARSTFSQHTAMQ